jgi:branched-chain amino acid transport system substrate-binding protein
MTTVRLQEFKGGKMSASRNLLAALALCLLAFAARAEDGITDNTILIGQTIGITGSVAGIVKEINEGANAYFSMVNRQGGVNGRKIELRILDDKFKPELAKENADTLIRKDKVFALFQSRGTPQTEAILPVLAAYKVPLVAPSTGADMFHTPVNRWVFNVRTKYHSEVLKAIEHFNTIGFKKIGLLTYEKEDPLGLDGVNAFNKGMAAHKLTPAFVQIFPRQNPDFKATAERVNTAQPEALIVVSSGKNTVEVIKEIRAQGGQMQIMTLSNNSSKEFIEGLGSAAAGLIVSQITPPPDSVTTLLGQEFKAAAKAHGATMSYAAMEGFVSAKVLVEGLRRAGKNPTRNGFMRALESMQRTDMGGLLITYNEKDHSGSDFVELSLVDKNGRFMR